MKKVKVKIGIDEAGRGCLAGPVVVCAALIPIGFKHPKYLPILRDSKIMSTTQREAWHSWITKEGEGQRISVFIASVTPHTIDKLNISRAANLAASKCLDRMLKIHKGIKADVILDGGLFLKDKIWQQQYLSSQLISIQTSSFADKQFPAVQIAAIMAKVTRDAYMKKIALKYKNFGFEKHKGYGTEAHIKAIRAMGPIAGLHRKTFLTRLVSDNFASLRE